MKKSLLFLFSFLLLSNITYAASIAKLRGQRALIHLEGLTAKKGDRFYSLDANNKKRALLRITSVKSGKAIGLVVRGKAQEGQKLQAVASSTSKSSQDTSLPPAPRSSMSNLGILGSYLVNQMSAKFSLDGVEKNVSMTGNGFGIHGYYDYKLTQKTQLRGSLGVEQFQVAKAETTPICDEGTSTTCNAIITYLSGYGIAKYNFLDSYTKAWFGGGGGYLIAVSKASTVLDSSQISANYVLTLNAGIDINMKHGQYLPVVLEYSLFPPSNTVSASYIALRVGWGWR